MWLVHLFPFCPWTFGRTNFKTKWWISRAFPRHNTFIYGCALTPSELKLLSDCMFSLPGVCVWAKISGRVLSVGGVSPERNWRNIISLHCQLHCRTPCWGHNRILARTRTHCPTLEGYHHLYTNLAVFQVDIGIFTAYQPGNAFHLQHDGIISWTNFFNLLRIKRTCTINCGNNWSCITLSEFIHCMIILLAQRNLMHHVWSCICDGCTYSHLSWSFFTNIQNKHMN